MGAAAPWFYDGELGRYAASLQTLAQQAKADRLGLWRACQRTRYDPHHATVTRR